jgi:hypothetical protein
VIIPPHACTITDYHNSAPAWFSKTTLRLFDEMGAPWFRLWLDGEVEKPHPKGADQGLALDALLTEGRDALTRFAFAPVGLDRRTKAGKEWADLNAGRTILSAEDAMILEDAAAAVRACSAWPAIERSMPQHTIRRHSPALSFGLQSRPDWLHVGSATLFDLKKTRDLNRFGAQAIDLGYILQAAVAKWCLGDDDIDLAGAYLICVEWERGARCRVYEIPFDALEYANSQMRKIAEEIARRLSENDWIDHQPQAEPLEIPGWMRKKMDSMA